MRSAGNVPALPKCMTALLHLCLGRCLWVGHSQRRQRRDRQMNQSWTNDLSKDLKVYIFTWWSKMQELHMKLSCVPILVLTITNEHLMPLWGTWDSYNIKEDFVCFWTWWENMENVSLSFPGCVIPMDHLSGSWKGMFAATASEGDHKLSLVMNTTNWNSKHLGKVHWVGQ